MYPSNKREHYCQDYKTRKQSAGLLCERGLGLCLWGQGDPGFWFPPLPGGFGRHRVICSEISSTVCFAGGWERRQGVVGNERSNLLSVGCECVYCCTAVGSVWCWYVLWSGPDSMEGRQHTAAGRHSGTKKTLKAQPVYMLKRFSLHWLFNVFCRNLSTAKLNSSKFLSLFCKYESLFTHPSMERLCQIDTGVTNQEEKKK